YTGGCRPPVTTYEYLFMYYWRMTSARTPRQRPRIPRSLSLSLAGGVFLTAGWLGEITLGIPHATAVVLYILAYLAGGWDVSVHALKAARKGRFDIHALMVVAAIGAAILGDWPEGALLLFLFSLGHALEHMAMDRARNAIGALAGLTPDTALVLR